MDVEVSSNVRKDKSQSGAKKSGVIRSESHHITQL